MTRSKNTRRALLLSALSLLLCMAMLVGSTFAWFTDSVATGKNKIIAGNLDVELNYWDGDSYESAENVSLFEETTLWEPGHTEVVYLQVKNAGTLALKYKLGAVTNTEQVGTNVNNDTFKLSDHLVFKVVADKNAAEGTFDRDAAREAAGTTKGLGKYISDEAVLNAGEAKYVALVVYMPTDVGNEANYLTGTAAPYIDLGVTVIAKQAEVESDSFGTDYDKDAVYPFEINGETVYLTQSENGLYKNATDATDTTNYVADEESLQALSTLINDGDATVASSDVTLAADVVLDENWVPIAKSGSKQYYTGTFDGGGHTITDLSAKNLLNYGNGFFGNLSKGAHVKNVTFVGANVNNSRDTFGGNIYGVVAAYAYNDVTFENVHVKNSKVKGYGKVGAILGMAADPNGTTTLINCTVEDTTVAGAYNCGGLIGLAQNEVVLENCSTKNVTWERDPSETYVTFENQATDIEGIVLDGTFWKYYYDKTDTTYAYAGWGDYYTDYYHANDNPSATVVLDGVTYTLADGLCHNK